MDIRKVKKLIELMEESDVSEIEIKEGEESVRIARHAGSSHSANSHIHGLSAHTHSFSSHSDSTRGYFHLPRYSSNYWQCQGCIVQLKVIGCLVSTSKHGLLSFTRFTLSARAAISRTAARTSSSVSATEMIWVTGTGETGSGRAVTTRSASAKAGGRSAMSADATPVWPTMISTPHRAATASRSAAWLALSAPTR